MNICILLNLIVYLYCNHKQDMTYKLTEEEVELIEAIRNFKNSKHNPSKELEEYAWILFQKLMDE